MLIYKPVKKKNKKLTDNNHIVKNIRTEHNCLRMKTPNHDTITQLHKLTIQISI